MGALFNSNELLRLASSQHHIHVRYASSILDLLEGGKESMHTVNALSHFESFFKRLHMGLPEFYTQNPSKNIFGVLPDYMTFTASYAPEELTLGEQKQRIEDHLGTLDCLTSSAQMVVPAHVPLFYKGYLERHQALMEASSFRNLR